MVLTENIKAYCEREGISRQRFEKMCGLSNGCIYKYETGVSTAPTLTTLMKIESATGIPYTRWLKKGAIHGKRQTTANHPEN